MGNEQEAAGEDDGHDAGLVDQHGQVLPVAAEDAASADVLGALRGDAALPLADEHDAHHDADKEQDEHEYFFRAHLAAQLHAAFLDDRRDQLAPGARHAGENARHNQQADAVADAVFVDLLAEPHEEHGARRHREHAGQLPAEGQVAVDQEPLIDELEFAQGRQVAPALAKTEQHRGVAGVFVDFFASAFSLLLQLLQGRIDAGQELEDDGRGNVRHDAQAEDRRLVDLAGAEDRRLIQQVGPASGAAPPHDSSIFF